MVLAPEMLVEEVAEQPVTCPDCEKEFKNRAGAGAHRSRIHGKHLDGAPARGSNGHMITVTFHIDNVDVVVMMDREDAKTILANYPAAVLDTLIG